MRLSAFLDGASCERLILSLAHFLWQGAVVALALVLAGPLLSRASPRTRHAVLVTSLLLLAACPPLDFALLGRGGGEIGDPAAAAAPAARSGPRPTSADPAAAPAGGAKAAK